MSEVSIAIMDRSELFIAGLRQKLLVQRDFRLLDCDPAHEPLQFIEANDIDVALIDIDFPISEGLKLSRSIAQLYPNTKVIILSSQYSDEELFESIKTGAAAYVDKRTSADELINIIIRASRGEYPINDSVMARHTVADRILQRFQEMTLMGPVIEKVSAPLTHREIQILTHIANGNTNRSIAIALGISEQTIKNHVSAILRKLNANDRANAVALAMKNQWVAVDEQF